MIIDTSNGTHILGSNFDRLITTYRPCEGEDYQHTTIGSLHYADNWLLLQLEDEEIPRYYAAQLKIRFGLNLHWRSLWGAHVSIIRGTPITENQDKWGSDEGKLIQIKYTHDIFTNGDHFWLNVDCEELAAIRSFYGLPPNKRYFHLTVGRTK